LGDWGDVRIAITSWDAPFAVWRAGLGSARTRILKAVNVYWRNIAGSATVRRHKPGGSRYWRSEMRSANWKRASDSAGGKSEVYFAHRDQFQGQRRVEQGEALQGEGLSRFRSVELGGPTRAEIEQQHRQGHSFSPHWAL
jgi:hypothetical protein